MAAMRKDIEDADDKIIEQRNSVVSSMGGASISSIVEVDEEVSEGE